MQVDVWSDVICPWCYIGKRRLEEALGRFDHEVSVTWRSFELAPGAAAERPGDMASHLGRKYGMSPEQAEAAIARITGLGAAAGIELRYGETKPGNTFDAHRLLHLAAERGIQDRVKERFFAAYFTETVPIGRRDVLSTVAVGAGLPREDVERVLDTDAFAAEVRADEARAAELELTGVPAFLIDGKFLIPGAQDPDTMLRVLERAWERRGSAGS